MTSVAPRQFYDSDYHFAQDAANPDQRRIWRALRHLCPMDGADVLDLGCGAGWAARMAKEKGRARRVVGVDFSRTALELARRHFDDVLWVQADGASLPLADESVDRLFCNGSLEHFPDVSQGLRQIARVLRTGGLAVIIVPNFYVRTEQPLEFRTHYWGWKKLIEQSGLRVERTHKDWGPPVFAVTLKRAIVRFAGKIVTALPRMQYQFVFVARKG